MNKAPVPPWRGLLQRKTEEHFRRFHADAGNFTRRGFLSAAAGVAGFAAASEFAICPLALADPKTAEPNPIPGGATAFGFHVHHNPLPNDPTLPLTIFDTAQGDPSEIGDFNGLVLDTMIRGLGTGSGVTVPRDTNPRWTRFRAAGSAMQTEYLGEDGTDHHGSWTPI